VSGATYRISGLSSLTGTQGVYTLTLTMTGVQDTGGNAGVGSGSDTWEVDATAPTANDVVDVSPDPRNTAVGSVDVIFSETINLATLTAADFTLTRDGGANLLNGSETVTQVAGPMYQIAGLAALTATPGVYTFTVQGAGVQDAAGNTGSGSASDSWTFAGAGPVVLDVVDVTPDPRNSAVASVDVVFDVPVNLATLTSADFTLTRDGGANLLTGGETVALVSGSTYRISGLAGLTAAAGAYQLTLTGTSVQDTLGTAGTGSASDTWTVDTTAPTVIDVINVSPDPRNTSVASIDVLLSESINLATLTAADFTLTRDGGANLLTGSESVTLVSGTTYRLSGLASLTAGDGDYVLTLTMTGVQDPAGNVGTGSAADSWWVDTTAPTGVFFTNVSPDPRNTSVGTVVVLLSETSINTTTFTAADFTLTRNAGPNLLTGSETLVPLGGGFYLFSDLSGLTGSDGVYTLTLSMTNVQDLAGNSGTGSASDSWTMDTIAPAVTDVIDVTPDPRNTAISQIDVVFDSEIDPATLTAADFTLTRDGGANLLTGSEPVTLVSGNTYRLSGLTSMTGADGAYVLTAFGAGVQDFAGNIATGSATDTWTMTSALVTADIVDITPDPRTTAVGLVTIQFSTDVTGVDIADFTLTRNAVNVGLASLSVTQITPSEYVIDLTTVTTLDGLYELTLVAAGSGIQSLTSSPLAQDAADTWIIDSTPLTIVDIADVTPDPRSTNVASINIIFSEPVDLGTLTASDFMLTRNGGPNLLTAAQSVTHVVGNTYQLTGLAGLTSLDGDYTLTLTMSGVTDVAGNAGVGSEVETWRKDSVGPTVIDVVNVTPDPRNSAVGSIEVVFSEPIDLLSLNASDFTLTRNGGGNLLLGTELVTWVAGSTYRLNNLSGLTATDGVYTLTVSGSLVVDLAGNVGSGSASDTWTMDTAAPVLLDVIDVTPDPRNTSVAAIDVVWSEPILLSSFSPANFALRRNGGSNLLTGSESISQVGPSVYRISGLASLTVPDADYEITVNGSGVTDLAGNAGSGSAVDTWAMRAVTASITDVSGLEGNAGLTTFQFVVSLSAPSTLPISIAYSTRNLTADEPSDYLQNAGTVAFAPGETVKTIFVSVVADTLAEPTETFAIDLSLPTNVNLVDNLAIGTILNDDATFGLPTVEQLERDVWSAPLTFTFSLAFPSALPVSFDYATADQSAQAGSDYASASGTVTFAPGETTRTVQVLVHGDTTIETDESFVLNLSNVVNASLASSTVIGRILNDDGRVAVESVSLGEGNSGSQNMLFQISLDAAHATPITVSYTTLDGTATAGSDYATTGGTVVFQPGERNKFVAVPILGDTSVEADETFQLELLSASGVSIRTGTATGRIVNDDAFLSISDALLVEGNSGSTDMEFWVSLSSVSGSPVTVDFATQANSAGFNDFMPVGGTITFAPGETIKPIRVPVLGDTLQEQHENFRVVLSNSTNAMIADGTGQGTIENDDVALRISDLATYEGNIGTRGFVFAVDLLGATSNSVTVNYSTAANTATAGVDFTSASGTLFFAPGETQKLVTVNVTGDTTTEPDERFFVNLSGPTNATIADSQGVGTILNDDNPSITPTGVKDDGDWGYTQSGIWTTNTTAGYAGDHRLRGVSTPSTARWTVGVPTGRYEIFATWVAAPVRTTQAVYRIDAGGPVTNVTVNQQNSPSGISFGGVNWQSLGIRDVSTGSLRVDLSSLTPGAGVLSADAILLIPVTGSFGAGEDPMAIAVDDWVNVASSLWQNPYQAHDVNNDGQVTPLDALLLINDINLRGARTLSAVSESDQEAYLDPDGNGALEPRDVLMTIGVINGALDAPSANEAGGEGSTAGAIFSLIASDAGSPTLEREVMFVDPQVIAVANRWLRPSVGEATQVLPESLDRIWSEWAQGRYELESADLTDLALESLYGEFA
jgi:hypothetical protein